MTSIEDRLSDALLEAIGPLDTPCWIWQRSTAPYGHGHIWFDGKLHLAHRLVWALCVGDIQDGLFVLHKCDIPACCNPEHLFLGTQQDNVADMIQKRRSNFACIGEVNGKAIIREIDIPIIRALCASGMMHTEIARRYGVLSSAISKIATRKTWSHVS